MIRIAPIILVLSMPAMAGEPRNIDCTDLAEHCIDATDPAIQHALDAARMPGSTQWIGARDTWLLVDGHQVSGPMEAGTCKRLAEKIATPSHDGPNGLVFSGHQTECIQ